MRAGRATRSRSLRTVAGGAAGLVLAATGCSSSLPGSAAGAPVLAVATGLWPLAQAAQLVGGDKAAVDDLVPPGSDPLTYEPGAAGGRVLQGAGLVLEVGGGMQPAFESAAGSAPHVMQLRGVAAPGSPSTPYVWLDPAGMGRVVSAVATAMERADPPAAPLFRRNAEGVQAQIQSLGIDFSSTLSTCPGTTVVSADDAFSAMAHDYGLTDRVVGADPPAAAVAAVQAEAAGGRKVAVVREPWVAATGVERVAAASGLPLHDIDTLAGAPTDGTPSEDTYFARMEQLLGRLGGALGCNTAEQ